MNIVISFLQFVKKTRHEPSASEISRGLLSVLIRLKVKLLRWFLWSFWKKVWVHIPQISTTEVMSKMLMLRPISKNKILRMRSSYTYIYIYINSLQGQQYWTWRAGWSRRRDVGSSMQRLKELKETSRKDVTKKVMTRGREGRDMFQEGESVGQGVKRERERVVISSDLRLQRCIEVCTADRSVMDFRMC